MARVLLIEPQDRPRERFDAFLTGERHDVDARRDGKGLTGPAPDVAIVGWGQSTGQTGGNLVLELRRRWPDVRLITLFPVVSADLLAAARRAPVGVSHSLVWDADDNEIRDLVDSLAAPRATSPTRRWLQSPAAHTPADQLVGESRAWVRALDDLARAIDEPRTRTVLLLGPPGAGKDMFARAIGRAPGSSGRYEHQNVANLPDSLFESLLFGHVKGVFTGAHIDHPGLAEAIETGVLFLNEIGTLTVPQQTKLLTFVETRQFRRMGEHASRPVRTFKGRLIFATNEDLHAAVRSGRFRSDLAGRLLHLGAVIQLPRLADRDDDVVLLFRHHVSLACANRGAGPLAVSLHLESLLRQRVYPNNAREVAGYAVAAADRCLADGRVTVLPGDLPEVFFDSAVRPDGAGAGDRLTREMAAVPWPQELLEMRYQEVQEALGRAVDATFWVQYLRYHHAKHRGHLGDVGEAIGLTDKSLGRLLDRAGLGDLRTRRRRPSKDESSSGDATHL